MPVLVVLAVLAVLVALRLAQSIEDTQQLERDLRLHTGGDAGEDVYNLAQTLMTEGVPHEEAVDVAATLSYLGGDVFDDLRAARLLALFEQNAPTDARPSRDLVRVAEQLEVDSDGLWSFLNLVVQESYERETPADVMVEGLREHGLEYATGCELVEQAPCPVDVVVQLALDRQQADYEQWGYTDCRLGANAAHPGCVTFAACADEYAVVLAARGRRPRRLGHSEGARSRARQRRLGGMGHRDQRDGPVESGGSRDLHHRALWRRLRRRLQGARVGEIDSTIRIPSISRQ